MKSIGFELTKPPAEPGKLTRVEAELRGLSVFDGVPCHRGHSGKRFVANSGCVECKTITQKKKAEERKKAHGNRFINGIPCSRGHVGERYSINGVCCECAKIHNIKYKKEVARL